MNILDEKGFEELNLVKELHERLITKMNDIYYRIEKFNKTESNLSLLAGIKKEIQNLFLKEDECLEMIGVPEEFHKIEHRRILNHLWQFSEQLLCCLINDY